MMKKIFLIIVLISSNFPATGFTEKPGVKGQMHAAFAAFEELQYYLSSEARFSERKSEQTISALLDRLTSSFKSAKAAESDHVRLPSFNASLDIIADRLDDANARFKQGSKGYSFWRLKNVGNYCLTCHSNFSSSQQFKSTAARVAGLNSSEQAEFYLATRQYDKALPLLFKSISAATNPRQRMSRLRNWLVVLIRGFSDPALALTELNKINNAIPLTPFEREEISGFIGSLERWQKEGNSTVPPLKKAENLIRQALGMNDPLSGRRGAVELLRATAILHDLLLDSDPQILDQRGHILYLLGLSYSRLPLYFVNELPDMFLEQCIKEFPNTKDARECFRLYSNNVQVGFTGSGGTDIPEDVEQRLAEFYSLAYGSKP